MARAVNNGFAHLATDLLPYYERALGVIPTADAPEAARREVVESLWPSKQSAAFADIEASLQKIDSRFSIAIIPENYTTTGVDGRWFGSHSGVIEAPEWHGSSALAADTTRYLLPVYLAVDSQDVTPTDLSAIAKAERLLRNIQPSWWASAISVSDDGFTLDVSPLDLTGLGEDE
jgi:hypothetical protein